MYVQVNWENVCTQSLALSSLLTYIKDYDSDPPSLCLRNSSTCDQGNVPLFAVLAESASDIQVSTTNLILRSYLIEYFLNSESGEICSVL
jgi:hypothetical protein